jgi:hypothetical protein
MPYTDRNPEADAARVPRPVIQIIIRGLPPPTYASSITVLHHYPRDVRMDVLAVLQFLEKLGYQKSGSPGINYVDKSQVQTQK